MMMLEIGVYLRQLSMPLLENDLKFRPAQY